MRRRQVAGRTVAATANVFISHSHKDNAFCERLRQRFEQCGFQVWLDLDKIKPADYIYGAIADGLDQANFVCVVVSPAAAASSAVSMELNIALDLERSGKCLVLPILGEGEMITLLKGRRYVDFRDPDAFDEKVTSLTEYVQESLRRRAEVVRLAGHARIQEYEQSGTRLRSFEDDVRRRNAVILLVKGTLRQGRTSVPVLLNTKDPIWGCYLFPYHCPELELSRDMSSVPVADLAGSWLGVAADDIAIRTETEWAVDSEKYSEDVKRIERYRFHFYQVRLKGDWPHIRRRRFEFGGVHFQWVTLSELMADDNTMSKNRDVVLFVARRFGRTLLTIPNSLDEEVLDN
jgi:hypothetical protein